MIVKKTYITCFTCLSFLLAVPIITDSAQAQTPDPASDPVIAEIAEPTLEDELISASAEKTDAKIVTFALENDLFGSGTDQYYTNGFRLSYHDAAIDLPTWARRLGEIYPGFRLNDTTALTYSIGQNLYTPEDITIEEAQPDDRPWAGWLYASVGMVTVTDNHKDEIELALGVVGPAAAGKITQRFVHNHVTDSPDPRGWGNQLENEPGVVLSWERRWPEYLTNRLGSELLVSTSPHVGVSLGNVYTLAETGFTFRLTPYEDRFTDLPARVRPALPGTGYYPKPEGGWSWALFAGASGRLVGRNIFLDGNTFHDDSPSIDKNYFVYDVNVGADLIFGQNRLSYTLVRRSEEFKGQDEPAIFGALTLSRRF